MRPLVIWHTCSSCRKELYAESEREGFTIRRVGWLKRQEIATYKLVDSRSRQ